jgi:hypothetical protein
VSIFVQATEHDILMYAKFGDYTHFLYLQLITSRIYLLEFSTLQKGTKKEFSSA